MNVGWKPWLPKDALDSGAVERAVAEVARSWSGKWFRSQTVSVWSESRPFPPATAALDKSGSHSRHLGDGLAISFGERERLAVAGLMLDIRVEPNTLTAADREALHDLADRCIDDLCLQLAATLSEAEESGWRSGGVSLPSEDASSYGLRVSGDEPLLRLEVSSDLAVRFIKYAASPPAPPQLQPLGAALARQEIALSAMVGRSEIGLHDLAALSAGDVLVLDRDFGAPASLAVDGALTAACASIQEVGGRLHLKIVKPFS